MKPLVFLHGWGQSQQIWWQQKDAFPEALFLNLAGHGGRAEADDWVLDVVQQLPDEPVTLLGWSLGGMVAMRLAHAYPERVASLILCNSSPSFCSRSDWQYGCDAALVHDFRQGIARAEAKTMGRFFALMFHDVTMERRTYQTIARHAIDKQHLVTSQTLLQGLKLLEHWDLRPILADIKQPTLVIHSSNDAVIPVEAGQYLAQNIAGARFENISDAGHAPFLTHPQHFHEILESWCPTC